MTPFPRPARARARAEHTHSLTSAPAFFPRHAQYQDEAARKKSLQYLVADAKALDQQGYHTQFVLFTPHDFRSVGGDSEDLEIVRFTMPSAYPVCAAGGWRSDSHRTRPYLQTHAPHKPQSPSGTTRGDWSPQCGGDAGSVQLHCRIVGKKGAGGGRKWACLSHSLARCHTATVLASVTTPCPMPRGGV